MNTRLEPPKIPPLTAGERARLRNRVMDKTRPAAVTSRSLGRRLAPVAGVVAVGAVVAGTLVVTNKPSGDTGTPVAGPSSATPTLKASVDGVSKSDLRKVAAECQFPDEAEPAELLWSRPVKGITKDSRAVVALARNTGAIIPHTPSSRVTTIRPPSSTGRPASSAPSTMALGYRFCQVRLPESAKLGALATVGRIEDKVWLAQPNPHRGLVALGGSTDLTRDLTTLQTWTLYRALPAVAKVEARYVLNGQPGPWTKGLVADGFAYTQVTAAGRFSNGQRLPTEVRAFDAQGKQIPVR
ncbi:hypothetical protein [Kribbella sp. NPDC048915]|uniref:hypothetical protein n=1 Tax=Kribbella sp. NPDC048915 TaxID=3155148 RepID=UPI0033E1C2E3